MKNHIDPKLLESQVEHKHGGPGYVVVQVLPNDYCRVVSVAKTTVGTNAYLAWQKLLKPFVIVNFDTKEPELQAIPVGVQVQIEQLRSGLESGDLVVNNTRITSCKLRI